RPPVEGFRSRPEGVGLAPRAGRAPARGPWTILLSGLQVLREKRVDHRPGLLRLVTVGLLAQECVTHARVDVDRAAGLPVLRERDLQRPGLVGADALVIPGEDAEQRALHRLELVG